MDWLKNNYQWLFSGLGVSIITFIFLKFKKKRNKDTVNQVIGKNIKSKTGNITFSGNTQSIEQKKKEN